MSTTDLEKLFYNIQIDFLVEAANIAVLAFPKIQFQVFSQKVGSNHAALVLPKMQLQLMSGEIGYNNLALFFSNQTQAVENFEVKFFPKIQTLTLSGYFQNGIAHLSYYPTNNYYWLNERRDKIKRPNCLGQKFEFLAAKFYPFLEEFFLG